MTDDPSSPSKKLVRETRTKNSIRMSCILTRVFSHARNLFRVGHSSIPSKFLVRVSCTSFLDGELGSCHGLKQMTEQKVKLLIVSCCLCQLQALKTICIVLLVSAAGS